jgi:hypothetical protein
MTNVTESIDMRFALKGRGAASGPALLSASNSDPISHLFVGREEFHGLLALDRVRALLDLKLIATGAA